MKTDALNGTMEKPLSRRSILKALGLSPAGAHMLVETEKVAQLSNGVVFREPVGTAVSSVSDNRSPKELTFTDFEKWWNSFGKQEILEDSQVDRLDADLIERRLPITTKVRLQKARNYARRKASARKGFERDMSLTGVVRRWVY